MTMLNVHTQCTEEGKARSSSGNAVRTHTHTHTLVRMLDSRWCCCVSGGQMEGGWNGKLGGFPLSFGTRKERLGQTNFFLGEKVGIYNICTSTSTSARQPG